MGWFERMIMDSLPIDIFFKQKDKLKTTPNQTKPTNQPHTHKHSHTYIYTYTLSNTPHTHTHTHKQFSEQLEYNVMQHTDLCTSS